VDEKAAMKREMCTMIVRDRFSSDDMTCHLFKGKGVEVIVWDEKEIDTQ